VTDDVKIMILNSFNKDKTDYDQNDFQRVLAMLQDSKGLDDVDADEEELSRMT
jgi:hypothetical protein